MQNLIAKSKLIKRVLSVLPCFPSKVVIINELVNRIGLWSIFMALGEPFATDFARKHAQSWVEVSLIEGLFTVLFMIGVRLFGKHDLSRDMADLYCWDGMLQGLVWAYRGVDSHAAESWAPVFNALILYAKGMRLLWPCVNSAGDRFVGWPTFGPFGLWAKIRSKADPRHGGVGRRHDAAFMVAMLVVVVVAALHPMDLPDKVEWPMVVLPFAPVFFLVRVVIKAMPSGTPTHSDGGRLQVPAGPYTHEGLALWEKFSQLNPEVQAMMNRIADGAQSAALGTQQAPTANASPDARRARMYLIPSRSPHGDHSPHEGGVKSK